MCQDVEQLDVHVMLGSIDVAILDPAVGQMHLPVEEREIVVVRPLLDLAYVAIGSASASGRSRSRSWSQCWYSRFLDAFDMNHIAVPRWRRRSREPAYRSTWAPASSR